MNRCGVYWCSHGILRIYPWGGNQTGTEIMMVSRKPMHIRNGCNVNMDDGFSKSIHGNNADKLRWDILRVAGWCVFPIMVAWQSGRMRRTVNPLVKFNSPQLFKSIRHHFHMMSHDEYNECRSEMHSLYSSCCSMRWRTGHSDSSGKHPETAPRRLSPAGAAEG